MVNHFKTQILIIVLLFSGLGSLFAQQQNPFDLLPRLSEEEKVKTAEEAVDSENPFDVVSPPGDYRPADPVVPRSPIVEVEPIAPLSSKRSLVLGVVLFLLIFTTIITTAFRSYLNKAYRAFLNANILNQLFRDSQSGNSLPYYFLYTVFFVNLTIFAFLWIQRWELKVFQSDLYTLGVVALGVVGAFVGKHLFLTLMAWTYPFDKELKLYSFTIMIFSIVLGFALIPFNLVMAYAADALANGAIYAACAMIVVVYLFRSLRGIFIGNKYLISNTFHFLLYICTVEVAPVIIIVKLFTGQL